MALLDLGLPDLDGVEVCRRLRATSPGTVLVVLTARTDEMDVVVGLEAGADDYLTKPFRFGELLARIRAHLRRQAVVPPSQEQLTVGRLVVDVAARRVTVDDVEVPLRTKEFELLARLAGRRRQRGEPRDADGRRVGRPLVRLDQDARRPRGRAAPQARRPGRPGRAAADHHAARPRLPHGAAGRRGLSAPAHRHPRGAGRGPGHHPVRRPARVRRRASFLGDEAAEAEHVADVAAIAVAAHLARNEPVTVLHSSDPDISLALYTPDGARVTGDGPARADPAVRAAVGGGSSAIRTHPAGSPSPSR
jgi:hypothetical protein